MRAIAIVLTAALFLACAPQDKAPPEAAPPPVVDESTASQSTPQDSGVTIRAGETGGMCGGIAAIPCLDAADYCAIAQGECVNIADVAGTCQPKPEMCTMDYNPACGCDGKTYGNACAAAAAGVSVATSGECEKATE